MNLNDLGAQIKSKYPQYQNIDNEQLARQVIAKYPDYRNQLDTQGQMSTMMPNSLGQALFPRMAAVQSAQAQGQNVTPQQRLGVIGEALNRIGGPIAAMLGVPIDATAAIGGALEGASDPNAALTPQDRIKGGLVQGGEQYLGGKALEGILGLVNPLSKRMGAMIQNPLPKGAASNLYKAADAATKEGANIGWDTGENNIYNQIISKVQKQLGWDNNIRETTTNFLSGQTPTPPTELGPIGPGATTEGGRMMIGEGNLTPNDLLAKRTALRNTYGTDIFGHPFDASTSKLETKIASIARDVISKNLHNIAPNTLPPDMALKIYNTTGPLSKILGLPGLGAEAIAAPYIANKAASLLNFLGIGK